MGGIFSIMLSSFTSTLDNLSHSHELLSISLSSSSSSSSILVSQIEWRAEDTMEMCPLFTDSIASSFQAKCLEVLGVSLILCSWSGKNCEDILVSGVPESFFVWSSESLFFLAKKHIMPNENGDSTHCNNDPNDD